MQHDDYLDETTILVISIVIDTCVFGIPILILLFVFLRRLVRYVCFDAQSHRVRMLDEPREESL